MTQKDEHKFTLKNDSLGIPSPVDLPQTRGATKKITVVRKTKKEESYKPYSSQTKLDVSPESHNQNKKSKFKEFTSEIQIAPSIQSVDKRDSIDKRD
jgi:hypothetical protein